MFICDESSLLYMQRYLRMLSSFMSLYCWLADSFVLDFFTERHWEKLPKSWRDVLDDVDLKELADFLSYQPMKWKCGSPVWPLSLQVLRTTVHTFSFPRKPPDDTNIIHKYISKMCPVVQECSFRYQNPAKFTANTQWSSYGEELSKAAGQHKNLIHSFRRCVKPKKQHEISRMAEVINIVANGCDTHFVVDVGSGQGHLSRLLSFGLDFRVASIEADGTYVIGAQNLDIKVVNDFVKSSSRLQAVCLNEAQRLSDCSSVPSTPKHVVYKIDSDATVCKFMKVLSDAFHVDILPSFILVGLHTCGNLASSLLELYAKCSTATALLSVPCCYMKLDDLWQEDKRNEVERCLGYPMSNFILSQADCFLTYEAKEVACHAIEHFLQRLRSNSKSLKIHCYRATLETLIVKHYPQMKRLGLRSVKVQETVSFSQYVQMAIKNVDIKIPPSDVVSHKVKVCMQQWKRVIVFYSLRLLIAPAIESLIQLDRMFYLWEHGLPSFVCPIFDPNLSPRNQVLISIKHGKC